jgi:hypothetical protein
MDFRAAVCMTVSEAWLLDFETMDNVEVMVANSGTIHSKGTVEVIVRFKNNANKLRQIIGVTHVPEISANLLPVSKMTEKA